MTKSNKIGFVGANPFGLVNWTVNAYEMGAQRMNPKATLNTVFTGAWNDPVKERAAAEALADEGVDVIGQHVDTPTPQIVAQERHIYGTGHHRDMRQFAPKATLCSSVWVWAKLSDPGDQEDRGRRLAPEPLWRFHLHQGRWHRYCLLQHRRPQDGGGQGDGGAAGHHRRQDSMSMPAHQGPQRQGPGAGRQGHQRRGPVAHGLVRARGRRRRRSSGSVGAARNWRGRVAGRMWSSPMVAALKLVGVRKSFDGFLALDDADLRGRAR